MLRWTAPVLIALVLAGCERESPRSVLQPPGAAPPQAQPAPPPPVAPPYQAPPPAARASAPLPSVGDAGDPEGARMLAERTLVVPVMGVQPTLLHDMFGQRRGDRPHQAIDIAAPTGTPVVAVDDGRIARLFRSKPGGLTVYQFDAHGELAYYYAHLQRYADGLRAGTPVKRGQVIGYVGSTGNADPSAPHLHFAVFRLGPGKRWWEGEPVNPWPALTRAGVVQLHVAR